MEITIIALNNLGDEYKCINTISEKEFTMISPVIKEIRNYKPYKIMNKSGKMEIHFNNYPTFPDYDKNEKSCYEIYEKYVILNVFHVFHKYIPACEEGTYIMNIKDIYIKE